MGTRATYQFGNGRRGTHTIYIHWDGYPDGAAMYFYRMLLNPSKGCMATQFIRANEHAELTSGHDAHGDTEYQYTLIGHGPDATLTAKGIAAWDNRNFNGIYIGPLHGFIAKHTRLIDDFKPFKEVKLPYNRTEWLNEDTASIEMSRECGCLHHLQVWSKNANETTRISANWRHQVEVLQAIVDAFPSLMTDEIQQFLIPSAV